MLSGEPFASAVFPFAPPVSRTVWGWLLMKPATSTKLALFCCYFYSTAGAVMQVFFYKTVTFWGCVDEVTDFSAVFGYFVQWKWAWGERSEPAGGLACGERTRRPARAVWRAAPPPQGGAPAAFAAAGRRGGLRRAGNQKADPLQMRESAKSHSWCRIMRAHL